MEESNNNKNTDEKPNPYTITVAILGFIVFLGGIYLGDMFKYNNEFNWGVTIAIWFSSFMFLFICIMLSKIIELLGNISNKLK